MAFFYKKFADAATTTRECWKIVNRSKGVVKGTVEELTDLVEEAVQNVIDSSSNLEGEIELVSTSEVVNFEKTKGKLKYIPTTCCNNSAHFEAGKTLFTKVVDMHNCSKTVCTMIVRI